MSEQCPQSIVAATLKANWEYFCYIWKHKWYVFLAGLKTEAPLWRLIIHDYSKFSPAEFGPYRDRFFGGRAGVEDKDKDPDNFRIAWLHHIHRNPHHWEHWILRGHEPFEIPNHFIREMVADWMGASRAITGKRDITEWYHSTKHKRALHPNTEVIVERLVKEHGGSN